ncbi:MAG: FecR family protein [Pseudomonadales bacterium]
MSFFQKCFYPVRLILARLSLKRVKCCTFTMLLLPALVWASSGQVVFKVGDPQLTNSQARGIELQQGQALEQGDQIDTRSGLVQIKFSDGSFIALQPQTQFKIKRYHYNGEQDGSERAIYQLSQGGLRTVSGQIGKRNKRNYAIETPVATIGIRGTKFRLQLAPLGEGANGSWLQVSMGESGRVALQFSDGQSRELSALQVARIGGVDNLIEQLQSAPLTELEAQLDDLIQQADRPIGDQLDAQGERRIVPEVQSQQGQPPCNPQIQQCS